MIKNIIFDFDGVLCESVDIKTDAFYEMYLPYGDKIALQVREHHVNNGGMSRFDKFKYYEKIFFNQSITEERMKNLSNIFSELVMQKVIQAPLVKGALKFLQESSPQYKCFIISATPIDEIKFIANSKNISSYFEEILGSPKNKIEWGKYILNTYKINAEETVFIGDAMSDYNASIANNMHFVLRKTKDNKNMFSSTIPYLENLIPLNLIIKQFK